MVGPGVEYTVTGADSRLPEHMREALASVFVERMGFIDGAWGDINAADGCVVGSEKPTEWR